MNVNTLVFDLAKGVFRCDSNLRGSALIKPPLLFHPRNFFPTCIPAGSTMSALFIRRSASAKATGATGSRRP
jgi:hypothetical protein